MVRKIDSSLELEECEAGRSLEELRERVASIVARRGRAGMEGNRGHPFRVRGEIVVSAKGRSERLLGSP